MMKKVFFAAFVLLIVMGFAACSNTVSYTHLVNSIFCFRKILNLKRYMRLKYQIVNTYSNTYITTIPIKIGRAHV